MLQSNITSALCIRSNVLQVQYIFHSETLITYMNKNTHMRRICSKYVSRRGTCFLQLSCAKIPYNNRICMTKTQNFVPIIVQGLF